MSSSSVPYPERGSSLLSWLPLELRCRAVSFLSPTDALQFSDSFSTLGVTISELEPEQRVFRRARWSGDRVNGDDPVKSSYRIPVLQSGPIHSAVLNFRWRDQGWGNSKGQLYIVASELQQDEELTDNNNNNNNNNLPFRGGRVVCTTELAPHVLGPNTLTFVPRESETYALWYKCGAGGGHQMHVEDLTLTCFVFDDAQRHWASNYQRLYELGVIGNHATDMDQQQQQPRGLNIEDLMMMGRNQPQPQPEETPRPPTSSFYPKMLLRVCKSLRRQLANAPAAVALDPDLVDFMTEYSIPVNEVSLRSVEEIAQADMLERNAVEEAQQRASEARRVTRQRAAAAGGGGVGGGGGAGFAFGPVGAGGGGAGGVMFGGVLDDDAFDFMMAGGGGGQGHRVPIPDAFGAAMNDFFNHMMAAAGFGGGPPFDDDDESDDDDDEEGIIVD